MNGVWGKGKRKSAVVRSGSPWTISKLDAFATYLRSYTVAGLHLPGRKAFIDVFVGTNYRELRATNAINLVMPDLGSDEPQALLEGFSRMALETNPAFHAYLFIDDHARRREAIRALGADFAGIALKNAVRSERATVELEKLCELDWTDRRAAMFLDPFGMEIEWATIEAIAKTKAIDLCILYPLGFGTTLLSNEPAAVPTSWKGHLDRLLGTQAWYDEFLSAAPEPTLFPDELATVKARATVLGGYFSRRLLSVFPAVAESPRILRGPVGQPLYLCCFATGSASESTNALRFANKLLERLSA